MGQLGPGVLTKRNTEEGGRLTDSLPMSTQRQPSNPRLRLGLLGCLFVDIGMKLHSVPFQSSSPQPRLRLGFGELDCKVHQVQFHPNVNEEPAK